jgi:hypothetical protein
MSHIPYVFVGRSLFRLHVTSINFYNFLTCMMNVTLSKYADALWYLSKTAHHRSSLFLLFEPALRARNLFQDAVLCQSFAQCSDQRALLPSLSFARCRCGFPLLRRFGKLNARCNTEHGSWSEVAIHVFGSMHLHSALHARRLAANSRCGIPLWRVVHHPTIGC